MRKLQATATASATQRAILRTYFRVPATGPGSRPNWITLRTEYNQRATAFKERTKFDRTVPGRLANIRMRQTIRRFLRTRDTIVIHPDRDFDVHEDIKRNLNKFRGKTVRVITSVNGEIIQTVQINVPIGGINRIWDGIYFQFMNDSAETYAHFNSEDGDDIKIIFTSAVGIPAQRLNQQFAEGITNCLFSHIKEWAVELLEHNKTEKKRDGISRYGNMVKKIDTYLLAYPTGVPEADLQEIANNLQVGIQIDIPFNESKTAMIDVCSEKKVLRKFKYINTRAHHVELNNIVNLDKSINVDINELNNVIVKQFYQQAIDEGKAYYKKDRNNRITTLYTVDGVFRALSPYTEVANQFDIDTGLNACNIDHFANPELSDFTREGTHFNETTDYNNGIKPNKHIDMKKAYTQYKSCRWYCGFLGKITDYRKLPVGVNTLEFLKKWVGQYRIGKIDISGFKYDKRHLKKLRCYQSFNVYPSPELLALLDWGITFDIIEGAWGTPIDFDFTEEMINEKDIITTNGRKKYVSYFAKWVGSCYSLNVSNTYYMKGSKEYFQNIKSVIDTSETYGTVNIFNDGEGLIAYPRKFIQHSSHITAFIVAYQRLIVLEQLFAMDFDKIRRVCVDGIYYQDHKCDIHPSFRVKGEYKLTNIASRCYCSGVQDYILDSDNEYPACPNEYREPYLRECFIGAGGNGKTHYNLVDKGLVGTLFIAPSWKLSSDKRKEYGTKSSVMYRALDDKADDANAKTYQRRYNTLVIDEASMICEDDRKKIFELYPKHKLIFCGDIGYQLPPVKGKVMGVDEFDKVTELTTNYRFKCKRHQKIMKQIRRMLLEKYSKEAINEFICGSYTQMKRSEIEGYVPEDIILCSRNDYAQEWAVKFGETKFKCLERSNGLFNGSVVFEKPAGVKSEVRHGFTVHSVQGETYEKKIYLDSRRLFSAEMGYTAVSRARRWEQIIILID